MRMNSEQTRAAFGPASLRGVALLGTLLLLASGCSKSPEPDTTPPGVPSGLSATVGDAQVSLSWSGVTADDLDGYHAYHQAPAGSPVKSALVSAPTTSTVITGLTNGTAYSFWITAVDESGNESTASGQVSATPNSAANLTSEGWAAWEGGDYTTAQSRFEEALDFDDTYADAHSGLGWTHLRVGSLSDAAAQFDAAIADGLTSQDARVGGLAAYRDLSGGLSTAISYGEAVLSADPSYVFSHDSTIDADVVRLLLAQSYFREGESSFADAQAHMDVVIPDNGLDPADAGTWSVGGESYDTYAQALLALIESGFTALGL